MDNFFKFTNSLVRHGFLTSAHILKKCTFDQGSSICKPKKFSAARYWKRLSLFGAFPTLIGVGLLVTYLKKQEGEEKQPPFVPYTYLRLRNKRFPWGDGNHSFFHNPYKNPLPDGYEEIPEEKEEIAPAEE